MAKKCLRLCLTVLGVVLSASAQETIDKSRVYYPSEEEVAANKRLAELLRHPTLITLRLVSIPHDVPREKPTDTPGPYKVKDLIDFQLLITQNSLEKLVLENYLSPYYEYRPELIRDGDIVPYTPQAQERAERNENRPPDGSMYPVTLERGREHVWSRVNLEDWYEPLGPGHYQLTVRKRFAWDGDWVQSNPVIFDVQPRNPSPIPNTVTIEMALEGLQPALDKKPYQVTAEATVTIFVVNNSDQKIRVEVVDNYYGNRPQLFKDGKLLPYREEIAKLIQSKEDNPRLVEVSFQLFVDPKTTSGLQGLNLKDWYGPLAPGLYRLVDRRRFEIEGPWTADSAPLLFEVLPLFPNKIQ